MALDGAGGCFKHHLPALCPQRHRFKFLVRTILNKVRHACLFAAKLDEGGVGNGATDPLCASNNADRKKMIRAQTLYHRPSFIASGLERLWSD